MTPNREKFVYEWTLAFMRLINIAMFALCIAAGCALMLVRNEQEAHDRVIQQQTEIEK